MTAPSASLQVAHRDDVARALVEVDRGTQDQRLLAAVDRAGVRVELRPERVPLAGLGVEDHDRRVLLLVQPDVGDVVAVVEVALLVRARLAERPVLGAPRQRGGRGPGTSVRTGEPGENPSLRFHSVGSTGLPSPPSVTSAPLRGIAAGLKLTLRPVSVVASATVKKSLGNGSRHAAGSIGSQPMLVGTGATGAAPAPPGSPAMVAAITAMRIEWGTTSSRDARFGPPG